MTKRFFSKPVWVFGNVAIMILCAVFFLVPFALRGARMAVQDIRNEVTDWLPKDFAETEVLRWFRPRFVGDQFVAISWDGCSQGEPAYDALVAKLQSESVKGQEDLSEKMQAIKKVCDELALQQTDEKYHSNWGQRGERWLLGKKGQWYYITQKGELFKWNGKNNAFAMAQRGITQFLYGGFDVEGERVKAIDPDPMFHHDPKLLCSRFFKEIQSGPEILQQLIGEDGPLKSLPNAELEAHKRLTGSLFGPTPSLDFEWSQAGFLNELTSTQLADLPENVEQEFQKYVEEIVSNPDPGGRYDYNGDVENLKKETQEIKLEHWYNFFKKIGEPIPPRQTAIVVVLNTPVLGELNRVVGREILGKPMGRIRYLAINECDISKNDLHLGGPPCDNVAIDEEGTITLVRLVGFSSLVGLIIAYASFRSMLVTMMVFFVGSVSAIASMGIVWYADSQLDAILLTMPSLVYVLGLSGAVHIVNYYREACHEEGHRAAAETAVKYGWFPCTLAAFTTSLGLISLYVSNLIPIKKFGLFSAIGTMVTVTLLFTYLPASLKLFPPGYKKKRKKDLDKKAKRSLYDLTNAFWSMIGNFVIKRHAMVTGVMLMVLIVAALGIFKIQTSVQLIKLFDEKSKVVEDYVWMEENLGKLVPMEIVIGFDRDVLDNDEDLKLVDGKVNLREVQLKYSRVDRIEAGALMGEELERAFGETGMKIVGKRLSTEAFLPFEDSYKNAELYNKELSKEKNRDTLLKLGTHGLEKDDQAEANYGYEFWRISLRLGSGVKDENVDYGLFVSDLKRVVEPVLTALKFRTEILTRLTRSFEQEAKAAGKVLEPTDEMSGSFYMLGFDHGPTPRLQDADLESFLWTKKYYDQTQIFSRSLFNFLARRGFKRNKPFRGFDFHSPSMKPLTREQLKEKLETFDCIVLIQDHASYDVEFIKEHAKIFVDARDHKYAPELTHEEIVTARQKRVQLLGLDEDDKEENVKIKELTSRFAESFKTNPGLRVEELAGLDATVQSMSTQESNQLLQELIVLETELRNAAGHALDRAEYEKRFPSYLQQVDSAFQLLNLDVVATYSGIVPIVYKAQRSLLGSLIDSICLAFVMIAFVMMILLRDWKRRISLGNVVNVSGGLVSMLPNVFPVVLIFGIMGHIGEAVDIGSMMTASVAMGVAVDDTIHFLNWFRKGLRDGLTRHEAIKLAYKRCGAAMTQTTLIGGLGLCVFGLSTFTPTQRFGILMLVLLVAALIGDLIFLPALLAGPLGKLFCFKGTGEKQERTDAPVVLSSKEQLNSLELESKANEAVEDDSGPPDDPPDKVPLDGGSPDIEIPEESVSEESPANDSPEQTPPPGSGVQTTPHSGLKDANRKRKKIDLD